MRQGRAPRVAVVGGGISGLTAAHRLRRLLGPQAELVLLEQRDRPGGVIRTAALGGRPIELGAEAFLLRRPEAIELCRELGLAEQLVHAGPARSGLLAAGRLHAVPRRTLMGIPAEAEAVQGLLSPGAAALVAAEASLPLDWQPGSDRALGPLLRERMGDEVVRRLVDPLLGGVYAGRADGLGLRATLPELAAKLDQGAGSLGAAVRQSLPQADPGERHAPVFGTVAGGLGVLVQTLRQGAGCRERFRTTVRGLRRVPSGWQLDVGAATRSAAAASAGVAGEQLDVDGVVLAVPAPAAARLLADCAPGGAGVMASVELSSQAVIAFGFGAGVRVPERSGVLLAEGEQRPGGDDYAIKAVTLSSRKWPHLQRADGAPLLRVSMGRIGRPEQLRAPDAALIADARRDLAALLGIEDAPEQVLLQRWGGGLPQYAPGHAAAMAEVEQQLAALPGLQIAGAALQGVGIPACVGRADAAARVLVSEIGAS